LEDAEIVRLSSQLKGFGRMRRRIKTNQRPVDSDTVMTRPAQWKTASEANNLRGKSELGLA